jgi:hypothetical protein
VKVGTGPLLGHVLPILRKKKSRRVALQPHELQPNPGLPLKSSANVAGWIERQRMIKSESKLR